MDCIRHGQRVGNEDYSTRINQVQGSLGGIASVLAGSIFGDHCSPISDTTVLSSTASACDHVDHVKTQLPYAVLVGGIGLLLGNIGTAYGLPAWAALGIGTLILVVVLYTIGKPVQTTVNESA